MAMAAANSMEEKLRAALEARDSERLLPLCGKLNSNLMMTVGGYTQPAREEKPVTHHVACISRNVQCLKVLVDRLGPACLTCKDKYNNTAVHCAALYQDDSWMQVIYETLGKDCFEERGRFQRTAIHCAAENEVSNSALKWLVSECGSDCLTVKDEDGNTPVHLAAVVQGSDSMELMKRELGASCFHQRGVCEGTAIHFAAMNEVSNSALKWLVSECGSDCLTVKDEDGNSPVHLAAWKQTADSLQFVADQLGTQVFRVKGLNDWTVTHNAAQNTSSNSALTWCVKELGPTCLLDKDSTGETPAHLAAQHQGVDSLRIIKDSLGISAFELKDAKGKTVTDYAAMNSESDRMLDWIAEQRKQLMEEPAQLRQREERKLQEMMRELNLQQQQQEPVMRPVQSPPSPAPSVLDPSFTSWDFILDGGKKQKIGEGGFGKVFKVFTDRHQTVAVKIVKLQGVKDNRKLEIAIEQEKMGIEILKDIRHPNILHFLKCERKADGQFCIFTELISGHSLSDLMNRLKKAFDESGVRKFSAQICSALNFLHCHKPAILHRDINCNNIMLTNDGVIKLIDFGLAKQIVTTIGHNTKSVCGTYYFMAPELFDEDGRVVFTTKTDVWAFGCTVFEMMEMQPPNGDLQWQQIPMRVLKRDMPQLSPEVSANLRDFYRRCVVKNPGERADTTELMKHRFLLHQ